MAAFRVIDICRGMSLCRGPLSFDTVCARFVLDLASRMTRGCREARQPRLSWHGHASARCAEYQGADSEIEAVTLIQLPFENRLEAGRALANELRSRGLRGDSIVVALARGGIPVGFEVADRLEFPLDVIGARKIGVPLSTRTDDRIRRRRNACSGRGDVRETERERQ